MKIINKNYAYGADEHQYILYRKIDGDWRAHKFFTSLKTLFKSLSNLVVRENFDDIEEMDKKLGELKQWIENNVPTGWFERV